MTMTTEYGSTSRTDQRFVAEAITGTGVTLSASSEWKPSHWEQEPLRREAEVADLLGYTVDERIALLDAPVLLQR